ncbi:MAG: hypothetical protein ACQEQV_06910 [Fibrobacterota bacterium]
MPRPAIKTRASVKRSEIPLSAQHGSGAVRAVRLESIRELTAVLQLYRDMEVAENSPYWYTPHPVAIFMEQQL